MSCDNCALPNNGRVQLEEGGIFRAEDDSTYIIGKVGNIFVGMDTEDFDSIILYNERGVPWRSYPDYVALKQRVDGYESSTMDTCSECGVVIETEYPMEDEEEAMGEEICEHIWTEVENLGFDNVYICTMCHVTRPACDAE